MRDETEIKDLIIRLAVSDEKIRAVLLNGSRANPTVQADDLSDFDIVFIVSHLESFVSDHSWTNIFGEKLIWQLPNEMCFGNEVKTVAFSYLMLFTDGNRIDLTLFPIEYFETDFKSDSQTIIWLDKDNLFPIIPPASDEDYHIIKPTQKEFTDTCNEFWWVSTYVAKGLLRNQITYAKEMVETVVRPMFMKMIEWKIGVESNFSVAIGKGGKFMSRHLSKDFYTAVLQTYADAGIESNWKALFVLTELFEAASEEVSLKLQLQLNKSEQQNTTGYLKDLYNKQSVIPGKNPHGG
ncbi:MAG TPA: aminoglycoside 6-adenylyltransferase [Parafilimonas sp.]|nr:aminoglycoside 6-adenylyltransferase [Parafilimonas sp.]